VIFFIHPHCERHNVERAVPAHSRLMRVCLLLFALHHVATSIASDEDEIAALEDEIAALEAEWGALEDNDPANVAAIDKLITNANDVAIDQHVAKGGALTKAANGEGWRLLPDSMAGTPFGHLHRAMKEWKDPRPAPPAGDALLTALHAYRPGKATKKGALKQGKVGQAGWRESGQVRTTTTGAGGATFARALHAVASVASVGNILEIGTFTGAGSTLVLANSVAAKNDAAVAAAAASTSKSKQQQPLSHIYTVESKPSLWKQARSNLATMPVDCMLGAAVDVLLTPTVSDVTQGGGGGCDPSGKDVPVHVWSPWYEEELDQSLKQFRCAAEVVAAIHAQGDPEQSKLVPRVRSVMRHLCSAKAEGGVGLNFDFALLDGGEFSGWGEWELAVTLCNVPVIAMHDACVVLLLLRSSLFSRRRGAALRGLGSAACSCFCVRARACLTLSSSSSVVSSFILLLPFAFLSLSLSLSPSLPPSKLGTATKTVKL